MNQQQIDETTVAGALASAGSDAEDAWDFVNGRALSETEAKALLSALPRLEDYWVRESVVRALTDKKVKDLVLQPLLDELMRVLASGKEGYIWAVGNALEVVARGEKTAFPEIALALQDERAGRGRQTLALAAAKTRHPEASKVLVGQLEKAVEAGHTIAGLRLLRAREAVDLIKPYLEHEKAWVRSEARKALKVLEA